MGTITRCRRCGREERDHSCPYEKKVEAKVPTVIHLRNMHSEVAKCGIRVGGLMEGFAWTTTPANATCSECLEQLAKERAASAAVPGPEKAPEVERDQAEDEAMAREAAADAAYLEHEKKAGRAPDFAATAGLQHPVVGLSEPVNVPPENDPKLDRGVIADLRGVIMGQWEHSKETPGRFKRRKAVTGAVHVSAITSTHPQVGTNLWDFVGSVHVGDATIRRSGFVAWEAASRWCDAVLLALGVQLPHLQFMSIERSAMVEALERIGSALGDRLLANGPLSKEYADGVWEAIRQAKAVLLSAPEEMPKALTLHTQPTPGCPACGIKQCKWCAEGRHAPGMFAALLALVKERDELLKGKETTPEKILQRSRLGAQALPDVGVIMDREVLRHLVAAKDVSSLGIDAVKEWCRREGFVLVSRSSLEEVFGGGDGR